MSKRIKKMTWDDFTAAAIAGSAAAAVAFAVLAPEKHSPLAVLKKPAAKGAQVIYNDIIPRMAELGSSWVEKSQLEPMVRNKVVDILYDDLSRYDGVFLTKKLFDLIPTDKFFWSRALDSFLRGILDGQDGRKKLSEDLAAGMVSYVMKLMDGSAVSLKFNRNIEKTIQTTVAGVIETLLTTSAGTATMNMVLDSIKELKNFNIGSILEENFGLDKQGMSDWIDSIYSKYVGEEMLENLRSEKQGDILADKILDVDPEELRDKIKNEHMDDVVDIVLRAASAGITLARLFRKKK